MHTLGMVIGSSMSRSLCGILALALASGCYRSFAREAIDDAEVESDVCAPTAVTARRVFPGVMVLLDRSRSMYMGEGYDWNYWDPAREAIKSITASLDDDVAFGLGMFPDPACDAMEPNCCGMSAPGVPVSIGASAAIAAVLDAATNDGGTPSAPSLAACRDALAQAIEDRAASILIVTDGAPNCNSGLDLATCRCTDPMGFCDDATQCLDDNRTRAVLQGMHDTAGVHTWVLGLIGGGGGDWVAVMQEMAIAGGTGEAYLAEDPGDVGPVMDEIARQVTPCLYDVDAALIEDPDAVVFEVGGHEWSRDAARMEGWDSIEPDRVRFYGTPCEAILETNPAFLEGWIQCVEG